MIYCNLENEKSKIKYDEISKNEDSSDKILTIHQHKDIFFLSLAWKCNSILYSVYFRIAIFT